jgi:hypothetical protein
VLVSSREPVSTARENAIEESVMEERGHREVFS